MNTLATRIDGSRSPARKQKLLIIDEELNQILIEKARDGKRKVVVSVTGICDLTGLHERTVRSVGFPSVYDTHFKACNYQKWKGLKINLEDYFQETGLIDNPENFWRPE